MPFDVENSDTWQFTVNDGDGHSIKLLELVKDPVSPEEEYRTDGTQAVRTYLCEWEERQMAARALIGFPRIKGTGSGRWLYRKVPHHCEDFLNESGQPYLYATQIPKCVGYGVPTQGPMISNQDAAIHRYAKLTVLYETLTYDILEDSEVTTRDGNGNPFEAGIERYVTPQVGPQAQYLTLPQGAFNFVGLGTPVLGQPGLIVPNYDFSLTWHQIPQAAVATRLFNRTLETPDIDLCLGKVNKVAFCGCRPGTLLLVAAALKRQRSAFGDRIFDIEYRLKFFNPGDDQNDDDTPAGHNHVYASKISTGDVTLVGYYEVATTGKAADTPDPPYGTNIILSGSGAAEENTAGNDNVNLFNWYDFNLLFRVPS